MIYYNRKNLFRIISKYLIFVILVLSLSLEALAKIVNKDIDPIGYNLCLMIGMSQYNITRLISIISIMCLGVLSLMGKLSWIITLTILVGIIIIHEAPKIAGVIYGDLTEYCTGNDWPGYGNDDVIGVALCKIVKLFRSNTMRGIALIGIIVLGLQALKGKLSSTTVLMSVIGIILLFAAPSILVSIHGQNDFDQNCFGRREGVDAS